MTELDKQRKQSANKYVAMCASKINRIYIYIYIYRYLNTTEYGLQSRYNTLKRTQYNTWNSRTFANETLMKRCNLLQEITA